MSRLGRAAGGFAAGWGNKGEYIFGQVVINERCESAGGGFVGEYYNF
jgi:hypothetical protein